VTWTRKRFYVLPNFKAPQPKKSDGQRIEARPGAIESRRQKFQIDHPDSKKAAIPPHRDTPPNFSDD